MRRCCGLQETRTPHEAVHLFLNPYYVISVVIYSVFNLFLFIGSEEHGCLSLLPILKTSSIGVEGNGRNKQKAYGRSL